ncbi:MAG: DUF423 domain-containing protein [Bdellovibrio sp.]|nr:DUF423 domain-containing protein [Bdellovibrio sp.]
MNKQWILIGAMSAFFGVVLGAFGGHFLKERLTEKAFSIYQIGIQYQMWHALALILLGVWGASQGSMDTSWPGMAFSAGIVLFSGSLYALALTDLHFLGMITPLGGVSFLVGWIGFAFLAFRS